MAKKIDRRIRKTLNALQEALLALIVEKNFDDITVEEITARADVGRTTFYLHYTDKTHLLAACVTARAEETRQQEEPILDLFRDAQENKALFETILSGKGGVEALQQTYHDVSRMAQEVFELQIESHQLTPVIAPDYMAYHFAGGLMTLVYWWLREGEERYTAEEMAEQFHKLTMLGRTYGLGVDPADGDLLHSLGSFADYAG